MSGERVPRDTIVAAPPVAVVVGGSGAMGRWFAAYLKKKGYRVVLVARNVGRLVVAAEELGVEYSEALEGDLAVPAADLVVVSVPVRSTGPVMERCARLAKPGTHLVEVASVKGDLPELARRLEEEHGVHCACVHPMFGPGAESLAGRTVVFVPLHPESDPSPAEARLLEWCRSEGANVVFSTASRHDRAVATTLCATHFVNLAFGALVSFSGLSLEELGRFAGTTFAAQKTVSMAVFQESPEAYAQIQFENEAFVEALDEFAGWVREYAEAARKGDYGWFVEQFARARRHLERDPGFELAYRRFYAMVDAARAIR
ncbi:MAG: hypothetical protein Kow0069_20820 [Promethearchaeota archaeon]